MVACTGSGSDSTQFFIHYGSQVVIALCGQTLHKMWWLQEYTEHSCEQNTQLVPMWTTPARMLPPCIAIMQIIKTIEASCFIHMLGCNFNMHIIYFAGIVIWTSILIVACTSVFVCGERRNSAWVHTKVYCFFSRFQNLCVRVGVLVGMRWKHSIMWFTTPNYNLGFYDPRRSQHCVIAFITY